MNKIDRLIKKQLSEFDKNLFPLSDMKSLDDPCMISVHCLVFNQEKYISRCIDSILMQRVNFKVEIIIHDDLSTDKSREIINSYKEIYPQLIITIYEEENLYSKTGNFIEIENIVNDCSTGKYIAILEGDDYWTDPYKLFSQFVVLENNIKCCFCVHRVGVISENRNYKTVNSLPAFKMSSRIIPDKTFISIISDRYNFQTSSYFFTKKAFDAFFLDRPNYSKIMPTDDEILLRFFGSNGPVVFIDRMMSTYVQFTSGSWSESNIKNEDSGEMDRFLEAVSLFDEYTNFKYHESCLGQISKKNMYRYLEKKDYNSIFKDKALKKALKSADYKTYLSLYLKLKVLKRGKK